MSVVHAVTPVANRNEVADEVVDDDLENIAEDVGTSYEKSLKTAIKHFNSYLDYVAKTEGKDVFDFETLTAEDVTEDLIGKFGSYLMKKTKIRKCDSALQNLSKVKVALHKKFPLLLMFAPGQPFYSNLRQRITQRYLKQCVADGTQMTDHSVPMREDDLLWMCRRLFRHNSRESMANRCLLVLQWQVMGRISEISRLRYDDINHVADKRSRNSIKINLARVKVGVQQELIVFQHATEWEICPLHALACAILFGASDTDVFNSVLVGGEAAYTNRLLTSLLLRINPMKKTQTLGLFETIFPPNQQDQDRQRLLTSILKCRHSGWYSEAVGHWMAFKPFLTTSLARGRLIPE